MIEKKEQIKDSQCLVCGDRLVKSGFFDIRFSKCPVCSSIYLEEEALVKFVQASLDNPGSFRDFPKGESAPEGVSSVSCRECGKEMVADVFRPGRLEIPVHRCPDCRLILLYPSDLFYLNRALQEEKRRVFQDALSGK